MDSVELLPERTDSHVSSEDDLDEDEDYGDDEEEEEDVDEAPLRWSALRNADALSVRSLGLGLCPLAHALYSLPFALCILALLFLFLCSARQTVTS